MSRLSLILLRMSQSDVKKDKNQKSKMKLDEGEGSPLRSSNAIELLEGGSNQMENPPSEQHTNEITGSHQSSHDSGITTPVKPTEKGQLSSNDPAVDTSFEMLPRSRSTSKESAREGSFEMIPKIRSASKDSVPGTPIETNSKGQRESGHNLTKAKNESGSSKGPSHDKIHVKSKPSDPSNKKKSSGSNLVKKSESSNDANKETGNLSKKSSRILSKTKSISKSNVRETEDKKDILAISDEHVTDKVVSKDSESKETKKTNSVESHLANIIELSSIEEKQPRKLKENDENLTEQSDADTTTAETATNKCEHPKKEDPLGSDNKKDIEKSDNAQPASGEKLCYSQDQSALETLNTIKEILVKLETTIAGNNARRSTCSNVEVQTQDNPAITERSEMVAVAGSAKDPQQDDKSFKCDLEKATQGFHFVYSSQQTGAYDKHCKMRLVLSENVGEKFCKDLLEAGSQAPELNRCPCTLHRSPTRADDPNYYGLPYSEDVFTDRGSVGNCHISDRRMSSDDPYADSCQKCIASMVNESTSESQFTAECCQKCCLVCMDSGNINDPEFAERCQGCSATVIGSDNITDDQFDDLCQRYLNQVSENINDPTFIERCKKCNIPINDGEQFRGNNFTETSSRTSIASNGGENFRSNNLTEPCLKCCMANNDGENFRSNNFSETGPKCNITCNDREHFRSNNFIETCQKCIIPGNGRENLSTSSFIEPCQKCSFANTGSENIRGNNFTELAGKKNSNPSKTSSNVRDTSFTEPCKKCSIANNGASSSRDNSFSEPCKKCGLAKNVTETNRDNKYTDRNRMSTDQNIEMKLVENDFFNDGYPESNGGFSFSGKGLIRDTRSNSISKSRNVRFNESVDEKHVSSIHLSQANGVPYSSLDDSAVSSLAGSASYYTGRGSMQMPAHHRRGTPFPGSSQTILSPIEDETFVPLEFTARGSYYYEPKVPNANYGYDSGEKRGGQNAPEAPQLQVRQYEKPKNQEGQNISYSNCELDNIYLHTKGGMEDVKIFAAGQMKNIRIYAEGQLSNIMMFANGDVDNVEAFTEGDSQSMLTYDDGKEKLEFELIENNIDTLTMQDAFARNIFKNKGAPAARNCLKCQDSLNNGSEHIDLCTKSVMPKFNQSSACWFNAENKCVNVGLSANNIKSRTDEGRYDKDISNWDANSDILTFDYNGDDYLGKNCSYNSDDSTDVSLASNGNMNKSVNSQISYANTIKLLRNRSSVRAFSTSLQDSQPQTLTAVYTVGAWKPEDGNQSDGDPLPVNIRGTIGANVSQSRGQRSKVKFRLGSDNIVISNQSVTVMSENPDFTSVASTPGLSENVSRFTTPSPLENFENNQQFAGDGESIHFNVGSKISVVKDNQSRDCIESIYSTKEEQAEAILEYQFNQIDHSHNVVPFLESRHHSSEKCMQPLLENKFDFFVRNVQTLLQSRLYQLQFGLQTLLENKIDIINYEVKELINHNYDVMYQIDKVSNGPEFLTGDRGDLFVIALDGIEKNSLKSDQVIVEANTPAAEDKEVQTIIYADSNVGQAIQSLDEHRHAQRETSPKNTGNDMNAKSVSQIFSVSSSPKGRKDTTDSSFIPNNGASRLDNEQNGTNKKNPLLKSTSNPNNVLLVKNWPSGASRLSGLLPKCILNENSQGKHFSNYIWDHNNQKLNDMNEYNPSENSETTSKSYYGDQIHRNWSNESNKSHKAIKTKKDFPSKIKVYQVYPMLQNELSQKEDIIDNVSAPNDQVLVMSQDYKSNSFYSRKKIFYPRLAEAIDNNDNTKIQNTFLMDKERKLNPTSSPNHLSQNYESRLRKNMRLKASDGVIEQFTRNEKNYAVDYAKSETSSKPVIYLGIKANYHVHPRCRISTIEQSNNSKGDDDPGVYNQSTSSTAPSLQRIPLQERVCDCFYNRAINRSAFQSEAHSVSHNEEYNSRTQQMVSSSYCPMHCCPSEAVMSEHKQMLQNRQSEIRQNVLAPRMSLNQLQPRKFIMEGRLFISSSLENIRPDIFQPVGSTAQLAITQAPEAITDDDCGASYVPNVGSYQDSSRRVTETEKYYEQVEAHEKPTQGSSPYMDSKQYNRRKSSKTDKKLFFKACLINKRCQMNIKESCLMNAQKTQHSNDQCETFRTIDDVGTGNVRQGNIADTEVVSHRSKDFQSSPIAKCTYQDFCGDVATDFCDCLANTQETKQCNDACTDVDDLVVLSGSGKNDVSLSCTNSSVEISSGTKGSERPEYSAKTSSSSASKRQRPPKRKESSSRSISFKVKVGISTSEDDLVNVDTGRCIKEDSLAYGGRGPPGSKSRVSIADTDDDNSRKKYHRQASSSDDVCTDDVTTPSDFSADEDRCTRNKTSRSLVCKCSANNKPRRLSPNSKNVASRRYNKKQAFEKRDSYDSLKDVACECSYSDISPDRENLKRSNHHTPSHSQSQKFKRIERRICSKRADSDSNLDSEPQEQHCQRCSSPDTDKGRYVDEIGFVRERPGPSRGQKAVLDSKQRNKKSCDYEYETDDDDYSTREERGYQKYYYQNRASSSKTCPGRQCQFPPWSEKSANASSTIPQRRTPTFDRYSGAESKSVFCESLPVKCSNAKECGTPRKRPRTATTNQRASISTDEDLSDVAGVAGCGPQGYMNQSTAIYNLNNLPRWSPNKESCASRSNVEVESQNMYEKVGKYNQEKWDDASQSALYNNGGETKVKRRLPRGFFMYGVDESEE